MADIKKIKVNKPLKTFKAGQVIEVDFDNYKDRIYWKRRLEDAKRRQKRRQSHKKIKCGTIKTKQ